MKNFLLTLAFVLVSTFTFASNDEVVNPQNDVDTKEVVVESAEIKTKVFNHTYVSLPGLCIDVYDVYVNGDHAGTLFVVHEC